MSRKPSPLEPPTAKGQLRWLTKVLGSLEVVLKSRLPEEQWLISTIVSLRHAADPDTNPRVRNL